jgi:hypothetical protein
VCAPARQRPQRPRLGGSADPGAGELFDGVPPLHHATSVPCDTAFAIPGLFDLLEAEGWDYAIRIKGNSKLYDRISWLMKRGPGRPPRYVVRRYTSFHDQAKSWSKPRRLVAKVEFQPDELFPRVGFIFTNRSLPNERVLAFYNDRGTAEQQIKEGKHAIKWTRLSCMRFEANAVRLQLHALAYNLADFLRTLATPEAIESWSPTSLRERLVKTGARLVRHARYAVFQLAEAALPRAMFAGVLGLINRLRGPPPMTASVLSETIRISEVAAAPTGEVWPACGHFAAHGRLRSRSGRDSARFTAPAPAGKPPPP